MSAVEQQREYLKQHREQSWIPLEDLHRGRLFWAALRHPHHANVYLRPYIVVARGIFTNNDGSKGCMLAVAGLETNSGLGMGVYPESSCTWIRRVTLLGPRKDVNRVIPRKVKRTVEKDYSGDENAPLYIKEGDWEPKRNTIVDLSTLLVIEGYPKLLCRPVANLTGPSLERLDRIMDQLRGLAMGQYAQVMTTPTGRLHVSQIEGYDPSTTRAQYRGYAFDAGVNPAKISMFMPNDQVHVALGLDTILPREVPRGQEWQYEAASPPEGLPTNYWPRN